MSQAHSYNRQILLNSRPVGAPTPDNFIVNETQIPEPKAGEILLRTIYLSLDPYMRGRMNDTESYAPPVGLKEVMVGATMSQVVRSNNDKFELGDWVLSYSGWQDYAVSNGEGLFNLGKNPAHPSYALGILGMPGFTAYMGLMDIGKPKAGDTLVVAAATGPVGATVGQIAKLQGCKVVGIAGGAEKCAHAKDELGFDACIDHNAKDFADQLNKACDKGIDIYFENVGGKVFDAVLPLLNTGARVPVCGLVSQYNATELPAGPDRLSQLMGTILVKRLTVKGFIIFDDYGHCYDGFVPVMDQWLKSGQVKYKEHLYEGLESVVPAFIGMLQGDNFGKVVVQLNSAV
ncbi:NADP-dependent oxidoreductase [Motilimonas sp. 1_MG-2023]|uniref:NADP-dependent oxidoreductase n=1 Tax=Motilimonas sp. 1_MG-2023 TaxID=3062672 RepID=UPI0026E1D793|nr:NADP-dependent oxidoreductase [Motilimonas sp. 1_MG-2023]MDO6524108.1 NADP-dependent oxidoreductase [Motilimonas sp. 1_MG-2023]